MKILVYGKIINKTRCDTPVNQAKNGILLLNTQKWKIKIRTFIIIKASPFNSVFFMVKKFE